MHLLCASQTCQMTSNNAGSSQYEVQMPDNTSNSTYLGAGLSAVMHLMLFSFPDVLPGYNTHFPNLQPQHLQMPSTLSASACRQDKQVVH